MISLCLFLSTLLTFLSTLSTFLSTLLTFVNSVCVYVCSRDTESVGRLSTKEDEGSKGERRTHTRGGHPRVEEEGGCPGGVGRAGEAQRISPAKVNLEEHFLEFFP